MKKDLNTTAHASAVTVAILYVVCRLLVGLFPKLMMTIAQSWFHMVGLSNEAAWNLSLESFILGLLSTTVSAWIVGYFFAVNYNFFLKKK